jgi:hypothetical protein
VTTIRFCLPIDALVSPNTMLKHTHRYKRKKIRQGLAWEVKVALGLQCPANPIPRARITVERHAPRPLDRDSLPGSCKFLLDVLQPCSTRHPAGLGVISNDCDAALDLVVRNVKCRGDAEHVLVTIEPI